MFEFRYRCINPDCKKEYPQKEVLIARNNVDDPVKRCPACSNFVSLIYPEVEGYIPVDQCKEGYLYLIRARNSNLGIYREANKGFTISRDKFGANFLFDEFHWDTGPPFGTVKPKLELEKAPEFKDDDEKLRYLNEKRGIL